LAARPPPAAGFTMRRTDRPGTPALSSPPVRRPLLVGILLVVGALAGCGGSSSKKDATTGSTGNAAGRDAYGCRRVAAPKPHGAQHLAKPTGRLDPAKTWTVTVATNCGTFAIRLDTRRSPKTAASFASLVRKGFYDGLTFHRIVAGFVIQGGDPIGTGLGGPGYSIVEPPPASLHYTRGVVAMAKTQSESTGASGSQFFVVTAEDATVSSGLTPDYALLGKISSGLGVVNRIGSIPADAATGTPKEPVVMQRVTLASK
jgi:peptidyl-prolyl cis-trans isomerase B (cyclophilin B)